MKYYILLLLTLSLLTPTISVGENATLTLSASEDLLFSIELTIYFKADSTIITTVILEDFSSVKLISDSYALVIIAIDKNAVDYEIHNIWTNLNHDLNYTLDGLGHSEIDLYKVDDYQVIEIIISTNTLFGNIKTITITNEHRIPKSDFIFLWLLMIPMVFLSILMIIVDRKTRKSSDL